MVCLTPKESYWSENYQVSCEVSQGFFGATPLHATEPGTKCDCIDTRQGFGSQVLENDSTIARTLRLPDWNLADSRGAVRISQRMAQTSGHVCRETSCAPVVLVSSNFLLRPSSLSGPSSTTWYTYSDGPLASRLYFFFSELPSQAEPSTTKSPEPILPRNILLVPRTCFWRHSSSTVRMRT